jgi:hypothetical protein
MLGRICQALLSICKKQDKRKKKRAKGKEGKGDQESEELKKNQ